MVILSRRNPLVKELVSLKEKKGRRERGTFLVEGVKMVREAVAAGLEVVRLIVREDYAGETYSLPAVTLGVDVFAAVSDEKTPQGIVAEVAIPVMELRPPEGRCLLLDGLQDPSNVGAIVRTAVAAGYEEVYLCECADPFSPKSVRASMSGVFFARIMQGTREELLSAIDVPVLAADMDGQNVFAFASPEKFCLAVGSEGRGLSQAVRQRAEYTVRIPMDARTESLNAAVSAGMIKVEHNDVLILVDSAERPEDIDVVRAQREADEAREAILQKNSIREYRSAQAALARSINRLRVKQHTGSMMGK